MLGLLWDSHGQGVESSFKVLWTRLGVGLSAGLRDSEGSAILVRLARGAGVGVSKWYPEVLR